MSPALIALIVATHAAAHVDISGPWKLNTDDNPAFADPNIDDSGWKTLTLPGNWNDAGVEHFAGVGWLRKTVTLSPKDAPPTGELAVALGPIVDAYEIYVDGQK